MNFKHFIITRFNTSLMSEPIYLERKGVDLRYNEEWLAKRVEYFEKVCAPTINNQTNKNFAWLVLFGQRTESDFVRSLQAKHGFTSVFGSKWGLYDALDSTISRFLGAEDFLITTNVDSDDGISTDFIDQVQRAAKPKDMAIYVDQGVRWNLLDNTYVSAESLHNPFHTVVEEVTTDQVRTVIAQSHGQLDGLFGTVEHINNKTTRWLMGIHDINLVNRMRTVSEDKFKPFTDVSAMFGL